MADDSLRELERTVAHSPDDPGARLRLVAALARAGRRAEGLGHLATLAALGPLPPEARSLEAVLWRQEVQALEPRMAVQGAHQVDAIEVDPDGATLAWSSGAGSLKVADLATGEVRRTEPCLVRMGKLFVRGQRVFAIDDLGARLLEVDLRGGGVPAVRSVPVDHHHRLLDVSPDGERVLLQDEEVDGVYEWPALAPVVRRRCGSLDSIVDWGEGLLVAPDLGGRSVEIARIVHGNAPGEHLALAGRRGKLVPLGRGLAAQTFPGLTLHGLRARWSLPLVTANVSLPATSVVADARGLRVVLGGTPVRFDVDLEAGRLLARPDGLDRLLRESARNDESALWHPHADLAVVRRGSAFFEVRSTDGSLARSLPANTSPQRWTDRGRALVTMRSAGGALGQSWIEVWRS